MISFPNGWNFALKEFWWCHKLNPNSLFGYRTNHTLVKNFNFFPIKLFFFQLSHQAQCLFGTFLSTPKGWKSWPRKNINSEWGEGQNATNSFFRNTYASASLPLKCKEKYCQILWYNAERVTLRRNFEFYWSLLFTFIVQLNNLMCFIPHRIKKHIIDKNLQITNFTCYINGRKRKTRLIPKVTYLFTINKYCFKPSAYSC